MIEISSNLFLPSKITKKNHQGTSGTSNPVPEQFHPLFFRRLVARMALLLLALDLANLEIPLIPHGLHWPGPIPESGKKAQLFRIEHPKTRWAPTMVFYMEKKNLDKWGYKWVWDYFTLLIGVTVISLHFSLVTLGPPCRMLDQIKVFQVRDSLFSKNFPTYPWNIPQTPNQQFM